MSPPRNPPRRLCRHPSRGGESAPTETREKFPSRGGGDHEVVGRVPPRIKNEPPISLLSLITGGCLIHKRIRSCKPVSWIHLHYIVNHIRLSSHKTKRPTNATNNVCKVIFVHPWADVFSGANFDSVQSFQRNRTG